METRRASIELLYEGTNITKYIEADLLSFSYTDNASGEANDVSIELKDNNKKWIDGWAPTKGDIVKPTILTTNWEKEGDSQSLSCGAFIVDEPSYSGRPRKLTLGAVSTPSDTNFMTTNKSKTWQSATVKSIAQYIADTAGVGLYFDSSTNPVVDYIEQSETPDVSFLFDLCKNNSLAMKLYNQKIVIFNETEYEAKDAVMTIAEENVISWQGKTTFTDTGYDGCLIKYTNPTSGETVSYTFTAPNKTGSKVYQMNETASSLAEAERKAKAKLRELNKKEYTMSMELPGNLKLFSSHTVTVSGFGMFDGTYYLDKVTRKIGSGFTVSLEMHKVLEGY